MKKTKKKKHDVKYIRCGKHGGLKRWSIVCIHLIEGTANNWIPIPQNTEMNRDGYDWLCAVCEADFDRMMEERDLTMLRPICIDCVKNIRAAFDPKYFPTLCKE